MKALIGIIIVIVVGGLGWLVLNNREQGSSETPSGVMEMTQESKTGAMAQSVKEAMGLGVPMKCTYAVGEGAEAITTTVEVSGQQFSSASMMNGVTFYALFDGETQYMWTGGSTEGMKMGKACLENVKNSIPQAASGMGTPATQDYQAAFDIAKDVKCEPVESAPPIAERVPKTVTFTDQCARVEQSMDMMRQIKEESMSQTMPSAGQ